MHEIVLTDLEVSMARNVWAMRCKRYKTHTMGATTEQVKDVGWYGFAAEMAVANYFGIKDFQPNFDNSRVPDVKFWDVRQTLYETGKLIIYPHDKPNRITILVIGKENKYSLRGWIKNEDAQRQKYLTKLLRSRPPVYAVPQIDLKPISTIPGGDYFKAD